MIVAFDGSQKNMQQDAQKDAKGSMRELIYKSILSQGFLSEIQIESDDDIHFEVVVISEVFSNLGRVKRQQLVYAALSLEIMDGRIHAIALKTYTPEEWANGKKVKEENKNE